LSHACWLVAYPLVGALGAQFSVSFAALVMGGVILASTVLAWVLWPRTDGERLQHVHAPVSHLHPHTHDPHHEHEHDGSEGPEPHVHPHKHEPVEHAHPFVIDDHHRRWPTSRI
jgi:ABC-type nickel/cobalt efflux system permease component RcnA